MANILGGLYGPSYMGKSVIITIVYDNAVLFSWKYVSAVLKKANLIHFFKPVNPVVKRLESTLKIWYDEACECIIF